MTSIARAVQHIWLLRHRARWRFEPLRSISGSRVRNPSVGAMDRDAREEDDEGEVRGMEEAEEAEEVEEVEEEERGEEASVNLIKSMTQKLATEPVGVRVHDIEIKGNTKTKDSVIEAQLKELREVTTMQDLLQESVRANSRLRSLGIFDKCVITLDAGPEELPGTVIVNFPRLVSEFCADSPIRRLGLQLPAVRDFSSGAQIVELRV